MKLVVGLALLLAGWTVNTVPVLGCDGHDHDHHSHDNHHSHHAPSHNNAASSKRKLGDSKNDDWSDFPPKTTRSGRPLKAASFPDPIPLADAANPTLAQEFFQAPPDFEGEEAYCGTRSLPPDQQDKANEAFRDYLASQGCNPQTGLCPQASHDTKIVTVPVVWHALGLNGEVGTYPSIDQIDAQLEVLNTEYYESGFQFVTAAAYLWNVTDKYYYLGNDINAEYAVKYAFHQGGCDTLNIYTGALYQNNGVLGYAYLPSTFCGIDPEYPDYPKMDGIVIDFRVLPGGSIFPFDEGDTLVHETGHWLDLLHTFEGGCDGPGDYVDDTPPQKGPSGRCWSANTDSCPGDGLLDDLTNFMNYVEDSCSDHFTDGQTLRMQAAWNIYRSQNVDTPSPTYSPTNSHTNLPTNWPTYSPTNSPTDSPNDSPTTSPTSSPTPEPTSPIMDTSAPTSYGSNDGSSEGSSDGSNEGSYEGTMDGSEMDTILPTQDETIVQSDADFDDTPPGLVSKSGLANLMTSKQDKQQMTDTDANDVKTVSVNSELTFTFEHNKGQQPTISEIDHLVQTTLQYCKTQFAESLGGVFADLKFADLVPLYDTANPDVFVLEFVMEVLVDSASEVHPRQAAVVMATAISEHAYIHQHVKKVGSAALAETTKVHYKGVGPDN